jgi:phage/plasmid primase-like uncharacterized protein
MAEMDVCYRNARGRKARVCRECTYVAGMQGSGLGPGLYVCLRNTRVGVTCEITLGTRDGSYNLAKGSSRHTELALQGSGPKAGIKE